MNCFFIQVKNVKDSVTDHSICALSICRDLDRTIGTICSSFPVWFILSIYYFCFTRNSLLNVKSSEFSGVRSKTAATLWRTDYVQCHGFTTSFWKWEQVWESFTFFRRIIMPFYGNVCAHIACLHSFASGVGFIIFVQYFKVSSFIILNVYFRIQKQSIEKHSFGGSIGFTMKFFIIIMRIKILCKKVLQ